MTKIMNSETPFHLLSLQDRVERLRATTEALQQKAFSSGTYLTYYDERNCPSENHMIHEYSDRKELIELDEDGTRHFIKLL